MEKITIVIRTPDLKNRRRVTLFNNTFTKVTFCSIDINGAKVKEYSVEGELVGFGQFGTEMKVKTQKGMRSISLDTIIDVKQDESIKVSPGASIDQIPSRTEGDYPELKAENPDVLTFMGAMIKGSVRHLIYGDSVEVNLKDLSNYSTTTSRLIKEASNLVVVVNGNDVGATISDDVLTVPTVTFRDIVPYNKTFVMDVTVTGTLKADAKLEVQFSVLFSRTEVVETILTVNSAIVVPMSEDKDTMFAKGVTINLDKTSSFSVVKSDIDACEYRSASVTLFDGSKVSATMDGNIVTIPKLPRLSKMEKRSTAWLVVVTADKLPDSTIPVHVIKVPLCITWVEDAPVVRGDDLITIDGDNIYLNGNMGRIAEESGSTYLFVNDSMGITQKYMLTDETSIFGGSYLSDVATSSIYMESGKVHRLYGGGCGNTEQKADVGVARIVMTGGEAYVVHGGGMLCSTVGSVSIEVDNVIVDTIYGGGRASAAKSGSVGNEEHPELSPCRVTNVDIRVTNTKVINSGAIFGGGQGYSYTQFATVVIGDGVDVSNNAYVVAGGSNGRTDYSNLSIQGGKMFCVQGINRGSMIKSNINISGGEITSVYAGGENPETLDGDIVNGFVTGENASLNLVISGGVIEKLSPGSNGDHDIEPNDPICLAIIGLDAVIKNEVEAKKLFGSSLFTR